MKWEYWNTLCFVDELSARLTSAGSRGWELVWVERVKGKRHGDQDEYRMIFKRSYVVFKGLDALINDKNSAELPSYGKPIDVPWRPW